MPYHNLGSCEIGERHASEKVSELNASRQEQRTDLRIRHIIERLLIRAVRFLEIVDHQVAVSCDSVRDDPSQLGSHLGAKGDPSRWHLLSPSLAARERAFRDETHRALPRHLRFLVQFLRPGRSTRRPS